MHKNMFISGGILQVLQTLEVDAVLDMKWSTSQPLLAVGDAKGTVSVYSLSRENQLVIRDKTSIKAENSTGPKKFVAEVKSTMIFLSRHKLCPIQRL